METRAVQQMLAILRSAEFRAAVNQLPGYRAEGSGAVMRLDEAFETLQARAPKRRASSKPA